MAKVFEVSEAAALMKRELAGEFPDVTGVAYLAGHSLGELMNVELRATAGADARRRIWESGSAGA